MSKQSKNKKHPSRIADNRKARFHYHIESRFEAGLVLEGWEVKSLREGRAQIAESYIILKNDEAWLVNAHISPLNTTSTHIHADPTRQRKLLLNFKELKQLKKHQDVQGYTIVPLNLHWKKNLVKLDIAIAKGKKLYDKRETEKKRDWKRTQQRLLKK